MNAPRPPRSSVVPKCAQRYCARLCGRGGVEGLRNSTKRTPSVLSCIGRAHSGLRFLMGVCAGGGGVFEDPARAPLIRLPASCAARWSLALTNILSARCPCPCNRRPGLSRIAHLVHFDVTTEVCGGGSGAQRVLWVAVVWAFC